MAAVSKVCPICGTRTHRNALVCPTCGTNLADVLAEDGGKRDNRRRADGQRRTYDSRFGETDLIETETPNKLGLVLLAGAILLPIILCIGGLAVFGGQWLSQQISQQLAPPTPTLAVQVIATPTLIPLTTNTPRPTVVLPTVTPAPPSPSPTGTPGPCIVTVRAGDDLYGLASSCGHRSLDVIPLIVEMNGLPSAELINVGQQLQIPLPTAAIDATAVEGTAAALLSTPGATLPAEMAAQGDDPNAPTAEPTLAPTATLPPGVMWHVVQQNENMIAIAYQYQTNAETLSQLNPEVPFSQCDFSSDTGGPRCTVLLRAGQQVRVPAPSPTPTLSPTPSGSETATPTATATFNAPNAISPNDRVLFERDELITLRWSATGVLGAGDVYRVELHDLTSDTRYSAETGDLFYIVPVAWQSADDLRHEYEWSVGVLLAGDSTPRFVTAPRRFTWQGRGVLPTPTPGE